MDNTKNLKVIFSAVTTDLEKAFDTVQARSMETSKQLKSIGTSMKRVGSEMSDLGRTMTAAFTVPIVGVGVAATKMAMDFQQQMTYVRTDAGDTTDNIDQLSNSVLNLAKTSQFGPDQLAQGLYHLASLGLRGADAMNALNTAQQMASVGGADLESTASALGAALVTGIKGVQDYSSAAGVLDATIGAGNMRMQDLVNAMGTGVLPVFKNAGLTITDFGAALATLTDNGMHADEAATRLKMTVSLMEAPSNKATDALKAIGMTSNQLGMDMQTKGLIPALQDLKTHLLDTYGTTAAGKQQMAQALTEMFGGGRSSAAIQSLIDQLDRVQNKYTQIGQQSGEFASKVAEQQQTAAAKMKTAWSTVQVDLIKLGGDILPMVAHDFTILTNKIDEVSNWWDHLSNSQQQMIEKTATLLMVLGPGLSILGKMASTFGTLAKLSGMAANGVGAVMRAFGGAAAGAEGLAGVGAEAGVAAESLGGLAAVLTGPVGIALAGTAIAALGAYVAYKKFNQASHDLGATTEGQFKPVSMLTLANENLTRAIDNQKRATQDAANARKTDAAGQQAAKKAADELKAAQDSVTKSLDKFGQNSPQYQSAVANLKQKQDLYNLSLLTEWGNDVNVLSAENRLEAKRHAVADAVSYQTAMQDRLNRGLDYGTTVIGRYGSAAYGQVRAIDTLQLHIANVVATWNNFNGQLQAQLPRAASLIQGLGSTINRVQGQSTSLNASLQRASSLQVSLGASGLQGGHLATGTNYAPGGMTLVGEKGPEIVAMPRGATVIPADKTQKLIGGDSSGGGSVNLTVNVGVVAGNNVQDLAATIYRELQRLSRANGFNGALPNIGVAPTG